MALGGQSVTLVTIGADLEAPRDRYGNPPETETRVTVSGVRFRMESSTETTTPGEKVREQWKLLSAHPALIAATSSDRIEYDSTSFSIVGTPKLVRDMSGRVHHVKITAETYRA